MFDAWKYHIGLQLLCFASLYVFAIATSIPMIHRSDMDRHASLSSPSRLSLTSSTSRSWTVRSPRGLGSLTRRALLFFGETTMDEIANFNVRRRLPAIRRIPGRCLTTTR
ncbi:hypothetical protein PLICRDRAFT_450365 [Plicaturopsis crispa FD-325 SS-3]|uniref:Uncharacterized protein n=1 Tax=Plicaturopsis crispa FD-325 SS-3 TaxID=944288 RepID=A0A0C9SQ50_PLICR|nr:hypothetical protein PLICRDRAFT_450365 [Plicaturopsis crispa FD-325 SS-3]